MFTPTSKYDLDTVSKWLPSRRMQYSSDFEVFLGKILLNFKKVDMVKLRILEEDIKMLFRENCYIEIIVGCNNVEKINSKFVI